LKSADPKITPFSLERLQKAITGHSTKLPNNYPKGESSPSISPEADLRFDTRLWGAVIQVLGLVGYSIYPQSVKSPIAMQYDSLFV